VCYFFQRLAARGILVVNHSTMCRACDVSHYLHCAFISVAR
jgi:hypothetical protein